jgi:hypothetical protein
MDSLSISSVVEGLNNKAVGGVNGDRDERFVPIPTANLSTEGNTITHSAFCNRSDGILSGIRRISLITRPVLATLSFSFFGR